MARRFLKSARLLERAGDLRSAVDRAYYAMFHAASAALLAKGLKPKSHSGVIQLFGREYVRPGLVPDELGKRLSHGFNLRQLGDYEVTQTLDETEAERMVELAAGFVDALSDHLQPGT